MSDEVVRTAVPPASVAVPSVVDPSRNVTVPASVPGETVAVRVTVDPNVDGLGDDVRITDVATWSDDALEEELDATEEAEEELLCAASSTMSSVTSMGVGIP
jgi:hypothetical protein